MSLGFILFIILGILGIASGLVTITSRNPIVSALALIFHFFMLAGLYLNLNAQFLAVLEILVYAGAIMVLVIFVIMLLNLGREEKLKEKFSIRKWIAILFGVVLLIQFGIIFLSTTFRGNVPFKSTNIGTVEKIGQELFTNYLFPFEAISLLLLAAIVGSVILAKRDVE